VVKSRFYKVIPWKKKKRITITLRRGCSIITIERGKYEREGQGFLTFFLDFQYTNKDLKNKIGTCINFKLPQG